MRFYTDFSEAINEIRRDLKEMGIRVSTKSVQNINIEDNPDYEMLEVQNYTYTVTAPTLESIPLKNPQWCQAEFEERISGKDLNPGNAFRLRYEYWSRFLRPEGNFDYTYPERMRFTLRRVIDCLKMDLNTRRAYLPIFEPMKDLPQYFDQRIPCSLGYHFLFRQGKLQMTYLLRSSDFFEHFSNDVWLARRLQMYVAEKVGVLPGTFSHWIGSLHCFQKDVAHVF